MRQCNDSHRVLDCREREIAQVHATLVQTVHDLVDIIMVQWICRAYLLRGGGGLPSKLGGGAHRIF